VSFVSFEYVVLLLATFTLYYSLPSRPRLILVLIASYVFYCYREPYYGYIIAGTTLLDYTVALAIDGTEDPRWRRLLLSLSIVGNVGVLAYFKYSNFALDTLRPLLGSAGVSLPHLDIVLPAGISFYTFQEMSYTIEVYRRRIRPTRDLILFASFVSFFPQLVAGPIEKPYELMGQLESPRACSIERLWSGLELIVIGLVKKLVLADRLFPWAHLRFADPATYDGFNLLVALLAMPVALYLDFSAYTDIGRGSGRILGIELHRNFLFPFAARNPSDWWKRWHITLTRWMRDYVFLSMRRHTFLSFLVPAALIGLWHGAGWNFVLWGVGNGLALVGYALWRFKGPSAKRRRQLVLVPILGAWAFRLYSLLLVPLFFCPDLGRAASYWKGVLTGPWTSLGDPTLSFLGIALLAFLGFQFLARDVDWSHGWTRVPAPLQGLAVALLFYVLLFGAVPTARQFVYVQF
jgi:alginate O-acetyltransferase complex protein AlgI